MKINKQKGLSVLVFLLLIVLASAAGYHYFNRQSGSPGQSLLSSIASVSKKNTVSVLDFDWPPVMDQPFPDIKLISHAGEMIKLSSFKGKVILVEPVGMTCPACNAFSGAKKKGGYKGISPQQNLPPIQSLLPQYAKGITLENEGLVFVQLLLYDMQYKAPTEEDARDWAEHFGLDNKPNIYVLAADQRYINPASYAMIPGFFLIDKDFILRSDSTGHNPKHNLFTHLFPELYQHLQSVEIESDSKLSDYINADYGSNNNQFVKKLYASLNLSMPVDRAYQSIPHKQTTFNPVTASMNGVETGYLEKLFSIVDVAVVERVQTLLWYQTGGRRGENNNNYAQILYQLKQMDVPDNLKQAHELIQQAIGEQQQYFSKIDTSTSYSFKANDPKIRMSHAKLIKAYNLLMALFPQANQHNKTAFFDHLCALDFI